MSFTKMDKNVLNISALPDKVQNQAQTLKATFDQAGVDIKDALNGLINELESKESAGNLGAIKNGALITLQSYLDSLNDGKQDSVEGKGLSEENFTTSMKEKLEGIEEGANDYELPQATDEVLGGIRLGDTLEVVNGKVESKGNPMPDEIARRAIELHEADETIHMTADEKVAIRELQPVSEKLLTSVDTGVSGIIEAEGTEFNITTDMVGKRIIIKNQIINLPSPAELGNGGFIELVETGTIATFSEIHCLEGSIKKGNIESDKCIQPGKTIRRYISDGVSWLTNFEKVSGQSEVSFSIHSTLGSDETKKFDNWGGRMFASFNMIQHFKEYSQFHIRISQNETLDTHLDFSDCKVKFYGHSSFCLTIPKDFSINLRNADLLICEMHLKVEGTAFNCIGRVTAMLGYYSNMKIQPASDSSFNLFYINNYAFMESVNKGSTLLTVSLRNCSFTTDNITDYSKTSNVIKAESGYSRPTMFIEQWGGQGTKSDKVKWFNGADTLSRIGTSTTYAVG